MLLIVALWVIPSCKKEDNSSHQKVRVAMGAQGITFDDGASFQSCKTALEKANRTRVYIWPPGMIMNHRYPIA